MIQRKLTFSIIKKLSSNELYNHWICTNKQKSKNLTKELRKGIDTLDKRSLSREIFEKRIRLCNDKTKKEYLPQKYDPFLNGPHRGTIKKPFSPLIINKISIENVLEPSWGVTIYAIFLTDTDYREFEQKTDLFDKKPLSTKISHFFTLISELASESKSNFYLKG
ncbi:hypothetical protein NMG60_11028179, partial [Bertholletia excelsa]